MKVIHMALRAAACACALIFYGFSSFSTEVSCHDFSSMEKNIFKWPKDKKINYQLQDNARVLKVDAREMSGIVGINIPYSGSQLSHIEFNARNDLASLSSKLTVVVREADKEQYFSTITLSPAWKTFHLNLTDMKYFKWGSAYNDGVLDFSKIKAIVFNCYPAGLVFEIKDLKLSFETQKHRIVPEKSAKRREIVIKEIKMPDTSKRDYRSFPEKIGNVTIKGNSFLRGGKPTFLLGGWQLDCNGPEWIMRTLGIDVMVYNATEIYTLFAPQKSPGRYTVEWKPNKWYEAIIERLLNNGILFWHEQKAEAKYCPLKKYKEFSDLIDAGHFVTYDPYHPLGEKCYREMFKSWMRHTKKYPIFCYEIFNEMIYDNTHWISRRDFQQRMSKHYGSIKKANSAWGTQFASFAKVQPPGFIKDEGLNANAPRDHFRVEEAAQYPNLQIDWQKFQEQRCYDAVKKLMPMMRSYDSDPGVYSTLQSHLNLYMDYSNIGIKPEMLVDFSDFYSHECGLGFIVSEDPDNPDNIMKMLRTSLINDFVRGVCPDKPIFNAESPIHIKAAGASEEELQKKDLGGLTGQWKFFNATKKIPLDWYSLDFNDRSWYDIAVPGMWGQQGFSGCSLGLYRKTFSYNTHTVKKQRVFLNGKAFSDDAEIYLNGKKLGEAHGYKTKFTFDVTSMLQKQNILAVKISNKYFKDGMYHGGIRGMVSLNHARLEPEAQTTLQAKHYRAFLWSQFIHGMRGVMVCYQKSLYIPAARYLPMIKQELDTASSLLQPRAIINAQVAMVYPQETLRGIIHRDYLTKLKAPASMYLLRYYTPLLFSRVGLDVIRNADLLKSSPKKYRMLVMPGNVRISKSEFEVLKKYVSNGGVVVADFGSLTVDDDTHGKIDASKFFGMKLSSLNDRPKKIAGMKGGINDKRFIDGNSNGTVFCTNARIIKKYQDGCPAMTVNSFGKGKVYYIAGSFPMKTVGELLELVMQENRIKPEIELNQLKHKIAPAYVEGNLAGHDGRYALYLLNWGRDGVASVQLPVLPDADYVIRNFSTGNTLKSPSGKKFWSVAEIKSGIPLKLDSIDPVTLLLERKDLKPVLIKGISPARYKLLNQLWVSPEMNNKECPIVAISPIDKTEIYGDIPTARRVLTDNGYKVINHYNRKGSSEKMDVLVWYYSRLKPKDTKAILDFVRKGGGLLICGTGLLNYHHNPNNSLTGALNLSQYGFRSNVLYAGKNSRESDILAVICRDIDRKHPVGAGVKTFISSCAGAISRLPGNAETVITGPSDSTLAGKPILSVFNYGKGRVAFIADYWWLRPLALDKGDNVQLWFNLINYLAKRPLKLLSSEQRNKSLFITKKKLSEAEQDEAENKYIFKPFSNRKSYLQEYSAIKGMKGKDPIIDMLEI